MNHLDLFSGIGGFALAADRVFGNVEHTFCDNDLFCQEVLKKHWPNSKIYGDIRTLTADTESPRQNGSVQFGASEFGENDFASTNAKSRKSGKQTEQKGRKDSGRSGCDLLTGGFPCQPFSQAGRRKGTDDDRYLWPEMLRVIRDFAPTWVIAENVRGLLTQQGGVVFEQVCTDLEGSGYEVQPFIIPAVAVNAPHRRDRVWIVAHRTDDRSRRRNGEERNNVGKRKLVASKQERHTARSESERRSSWSANWLEIATRLCRMDDGIPRRLDRNPRLKALGNAIVPQVAEEIMIAIKHADFLLTTE